MMKCICYLMFWMKNQWKICLYTLDSTLNVDTNALWREGGVRDQIYRVHNFVYFFLDFPDISMRRYTFFSRCYCGHWLVVEAHHRWLIVAPLIPEGENAQLQCSVFVLVSASVFLDEDSEYSAFVSVSASVF